MATEHEDQATNGSSEADSSPNQLWKSVEEKIAAELPPHLAVRVPVLFGAIGLLVTWLQRQFEIRIETFAATSTGIAVAIPIARRLWTAFIAKPENKENLVAALRTCISTSLTTPVLGVLSVIAAVLSSFVSTVTVIAGPTDGSPAVQIVSETPSWFDSVDSAFDQGQREQYANAVAAAEEAVANERAASAAPAEPPARPGMGVPIEATAPVEDSATMEANASGDIQDQALSMLEEVQTYFAAFEAAMSKKEAGAGEPAEDVDEAAPAADDGLKFTQERRAIKFTRLTTPFGRPFRLKVEGYQSHAFTLYPGGGAEIRIASDLSHSPSVLARIPPLDALSPEDAMVALYQLPEGDEARKKGRAGRIREQLETREPATEIPEDADLLGACLLGPSNAAVVFGHFRPTPQENATIWGRQLTAAGLTDPAQRELVLGRWMTPVAVPTLKELEQGMRVLVVFHRVPTRSVKEVDARLEFVIGAEPIYDHQLAPIRKPE